MLMLINWCCALCLWTKVSGGTINQIHFWGKTPFQQVAWWMDNLIYFLNSSAGCSTTIFFFFFFFFQISCKVPRIWCSSSPTALGSFRFARRTASATVKHETMRLHHNGCQVLCLLQNWEDRQMTNLTHAHMNEIGIPTVLESSVVQIESSVLSLMSTVNSLFLQNTSEGM